MGEMADGNFAIATEHEDQYTGAFNALLLGIRNMNRQMNSTLKGVEDASKQVAEGSANLSDAAQSLAEGATDQAATVEEMQATINDLNEGIQKTAEHLAAHALYMIEVEHATSVSYTADMVNELF